MGTPGEQPELTARGFRFYDDVVTHEPSAVAAATESYATKQSVTPSFSVQDVDPSGQILKIERWQPTQGTVDRALREAAAAIALGATGDFAAARREYAETVTHEPWTADLRIAQKPKRTIEYEGRRRAHKPQHRLEGVYDHMMSGLYKEIMTAAGVGYQSTEGRHRAGRHLAPAPDKTSIMSHGIHELPRINRTVEPNAIPIVNLFGAGYGSSSAVRQVAYGHVGHVHSLVDERVLQGLAIAGVRDPRAYADNTPSVRSGPGRGLIQPMRPVRPWDMGITDTHTLPRLQEDSRADSPTPMSVEQAFRLWGTDGLAEDSPRAE